MRSNQTNERQTRPRTGYRRLTPWVLAGAMIPAIIGAQSLTEPASSPTGPMVTILKSPLYSTFGEHSLVVRVNDTGSLDSATEVTLEFRDAADQRRAFKSVVLPGRQSVELVLRVPPGGRQTFRAIVKLTPIAFAELSEPFVVLEDLYLTAVESKPPCPVAQYPEFPSDALGDCGGGWRVSRLTLGQDSSGLD